MLVSGRVTGRPDRSKRFIAWFFSSLFGLTICWSFLSLFTKNDRRVIPTNARWQPVPHLLLILSHLGCEKKKLGEFWEEIEWGARKVECPFWRSFPGISLQGKMLQWVRNMLRMIWGFPKMVGFPPKSSILIGFSIIFTIHFGGFPPIFWKHPYSNPEMRDSNPWKTKQFLTKFAPLRVWSVGSSFSRGGSHSSLFPTWLLYIFLSGVIAIILGALSTATNLGGERLPTWNMRCKTPPSNTRMNSLPKTNSLPLKMVVPNRNLLL